MKKILLIMLLSTFSLWLFGHGVELQFRLQPPAVLVNARYEISNQLLADAPLEIFYAQEKNPFQSGRTDRSGNFAFLPDKAGQWTVIVDDQMGHREKDSVDVPAAFFQKPAPQPKGQGEPQAVPQQKPAKAPAIKSVSLVLRLVLGVGLLLLLTLFFYRWKKSREA